MKKTKQPETLEEIDAREALEAERLAMGERILDRAQEWIEAFLEGRARIRFSVDPVGYSVHLSAIEPGRSAQDSAIEPIL